MFRTFGIAGMACCLLCEPSAAGTVNETLALYDRPSTKAYAEIAVINMEQGFLAANVMLQNLQRAPLYCQPGKLAFTPEQLIDMLRRSDVEQPDLGDYPLSISLLTVMRRTFPCSS